MHQRTIAAFDFDGTLTRKDSFLEFIKFVKGKWKAYTGLLFCAPIITAHFLNFYPNGKAKEMIFCHFFKGMPYDTFLKYGERFAVEIDKMANVSMLEILEHHHLLGHTVIVVSASVEAWVAPWCKAHGVDRVLCTQAEVSADGKLIGRFQTKNCYGQEKVNRLMQAEPGREEYYLVAYGDSAGDKELLEYADEGHLCNKNGKLS